MGAACASACYEPSVKGGRVDRADVVEEMWEDHEQRFTQHAPQHSWEQVFVAAPKEGGQGYFRDVGPEASRAVSSASIASPASNAASPERTLRAALKNAERLMQEFRILDAEFVLAQALARLAACGDRVGVARLCEAPVFVEVARRAALYESAGAMMDELSGRRGSASDFAFQWERNGSRLWVNAPSGATWFQTRIAVALDAPLHQCLAATSETDLSMRWNHLLAEVPDLLVPDQRLRQIVRQLQSVLMFSVEMIFEVMRYVNKSYGFVAETLCSDFPAEGVTMPESSGWLTKRVTMDTRSVWLPAGGGARHTFLIQQATVDIGYSVPEFVLQFIVDSAVEQFLDNFRRAAQLVGARGEEGDNPWQERVRRDPCGLYAELKEVEAAAAAREQLDLDHLPGSEVFQRTYMSPEQWRLMEGKMVEASKRAARDGPMSPNTSASTDVGDGAASSWSAW